MASRDFGPERRAVFERDGDACQLCGVSVDPGADATAYPVDVSDLESAHPATAATVCEDCRERLRGETGAPGTPVEVFRSVRTVTQTQSRTIADAADFASRATSFPEALAAGEVPPYAADRRRLVLAVAAVAADLETLAGVDRADLEEGSQVALEDFTDVSRELQASLAGIVDLVEAAAIAFGRCHVCFEALEDGRTDCPTCGTARRGIGEWRGEDGSVRFDALFGEISDALVEASETTEAVARRTTVLAETLVE